MSGLCLAPEGEDGVDEEEDAFDDGEGALGDEPAVQATAARVVAQDYRARDEEQGQTDQAEEQVLRERENRSG